MLDEETNSLATTNVLYKPVDGVLRVRFITRKSVILEHNSCSLPLLLVTLTSKKAEPNVGHL